MKFKQGWYKLLNPDKFLEPRNKFMKSYKFIDGNKFVNYKSSLELKAFQYLDKSEKIFNWSLEPIGIPYTFNGKKHKYFPDLFVNNSIYIELKPYYLTQYPKNERQIPGYLKNLSKWEAMQNFCTENNFIFIILTEKSF